MSYKDMRNRAMMLASQLPDDRDDAYFVIDLMKELLDKWLYRGGRLYPPESNVIDDEYYEALFRARGRTAGAGGSGSASNVIKLVGKEDKSPR